MPPLQLGVFMAYTPRATYTPRVRYTAREANTATPDSALIRMNDPYQVNSILDVLFNQAALKKTYGGTTFAEAPIETRLKALIDLSKDFYIKPMLRGDFKTAGLNTLMGLGEVVDVLANPVKALLAPAINIPADKVDYDYAEKCLQLAAGNLPGQKQTLYNGQTKYTGYIDGRLVSFTDKELDAYQNIVSSGRSVNYTDLTTSERLASSIGLGEYGRINYEYATGSLFTNIVLEILSDPQTLISMGTSALSKTAINGMQDVAKVMLKQADELLPANKGLLTQLAEGINKEISHDVLSAVKNKRFIIAADNKQLNDLLTAALGAAKKTTDFQNTYEIQNIGEAFKAVLYAKGLSAEAITSGLSVPKVLNDAVGAHLDNTATTILQALSHADKFLDKTQDTMLKGTLSLSGAYPVYLIAKKGGPAVARWLTNILADSAKIHTNDFGKVPIMAYYDRQATLNKVYRKAYYGLPEDYRDLLELNARVELYPGLAEDVSQITKLLSGVNETNLKETLDQIEAYLATAQKNLGSFDEVIKMANDIYKETGDIVFRNYAASMQEAYDVVQDLQKNALGFVQASHKITALLNTFAQEPVTIRIAALEDLDIDYIPGPLSSLVVSTLVQPRAGAMQEFLRYIAETIETLPSYDTRAVQHWMQDAARQVQHFLDEFKAEPTANTLEKFIDKFQVTDQRLQQLLIDLDGTITSSHIPDFSSMDFLTKLSNAADATTAALKTAMDTAQNIMRQMKDPAVKDFIGAPTDTFLTNGELTVLNDWANDTEVRTVLNFFEDEADQVIVNEEAFKSWFEVLTQRMKAGVTRVNKKSVIGLSTGEPYLKEFAQHIDITRVPAVTEILKHTPDSAYKQFSEFFEAKLNNVHYSRTALAFDKFINNLVSAARELGEPAEYQALLKLQDILNDVVSGRALELEKLVDSFQTTLVLKLNSLGTTAALFKDPALIQLVEELSNGSETYAKLQEVLINPNVPSAVKDSVHGALALVESYNATRWLFNAVQLSDMASDIKASVLESMVKFWKEDPNHVVHNVSHFVDKLIDTVKSNINTTKHFDESLSIAEQAQKYGLGPETHVALEDNRLTAELLYQHWLKEYPELKAALDGKTVYILDSEALNAETTAANQIHQVAISKYVNGAVVDEQTWGLSPEVISVINTPEGRYLNKIAPTGLSPTEQLEWYRSVHINGQYITEKDLLQDTMKYLDQIADVESSIIIAYNGSTFDFPALSNRLKAYAFKDADNHPINYAKFFEQYQKLDPLEVMRKSKGYITQENLEAQRETLTNIFGHYFTRMQGNGRLFTLDTGALQDLKNVLSFNKQASKLNKFLPPHTVDVLNELHTQLQHHLNLIREVNEGLAKAPIPKAVFETSELDDVSETLLKKMSWKQWIDSLPISQQAKQQRFGDYMALRATNIFAAVGDFQKYATTYKRNIELIDEYFIGSAYRVGSVTERELDHLQRVASAIQKKVKAIKDINGLMPYYDKTKEYIQDLLKYNEFSDLKYIRTENLNVSQQWGLFSYLMDRAQRVNGLRLHALGLIGETPAMHAYLVSARNRVNYLSVKYADVLSDYNIYKAQWTDVMQNQKTLRALGSVLDKHNLWSAVSQKHMRALQPAADLMNKYIKALDNMNAAAAAMSFRMDATFVDAQARSIAKEFAYQATRSLDSLVNWLANSGGVVIIQRDVLEDINYKQLLQALETDAAKEANILYKAEEDLGQLTIILSKKADLHYSKEAKRYIVNGKAYAPYQWRQLNLSKVSDYYPDTITQGDVQDALDALAYMTKGASNGSCFNRFNKDVLHNLLNKMPADLVKEFKEVNEVYFQEMMFDHSILGSTAFRQSINDYTPSNFMSALFDSNNMAAQRAGAQMSYGQAMFSKVGSLQMDSPLTQHMRANPVDAAEYFRQTDEYTAAVLVQTDEGYGCMVKEFDLTTPKGVLDALDSGAILMDRLSFAQAYNIFNNTVWSERGWGFWNRLVQLYKIGYLSNPGTWVRNGLDAYIKNISATDTDPLSMGRYTVYAMKDLHEFDSTLKSLYEYSEAQGGFGLPSDTEIRLWFKNHPKLSYKKFKQMYNITGLGVFGGEARMFAKQGSKFRDNQVQAWLEGDAISSELAKKMQTENKILTYSGYALAPMSGIERVSRYAMYLCLSDKGYSTSRIAQMITDTHFDYNTKTATEHIMEQFIPFYTFGRRNLAYWFDLLDKNPSFFRAMDNIMSPVWELEQYDPEEIKDDEALQDAILAGQVKMGDSNFYLNLGFSMMDALRRITDYAGTLHDTTFSPLQTIMDTVLQGASDEAYRSGQELLSDWIQNEFGTNPSIEQLEAKWGEWAHTYAEWYPKRVSTADNFTEILKTKLSISLIPVVGTQINRLLKSNNYYDSEGMLGAAGYTLGLGYNVYTNAEDYTNKREKLRIKLRALMQDSSDIKRKWQQLCAQHGLAPNISLYTMDAVQLEQLYNELAAGYARLNPKIYTMMQASDDKLWIYTRLRNALGYEGVTLTELPMEVRELIYQVMADQTADLKRVLPVLQDSEAMRFQWQAIARKYDVDLTDLEGVSDDTLEKIYFDIAQSALTLSDIIEMLQNAEYRMAYGYIKKSLGFKDLKLSQLPNDALLVIKNYMTKHKGSAGYTKRAAKPHVYMDTWNQGGQISLYQNGQVYKNTWHNPNRRNLYRDLYAYPHTSRAELMRKDMGQMSPTILKYRMKDMFYYYR